MKTRELGKSDIRVTEAGLGCGGHSRIGQSAGKSAQESADIVKRALAAGINLIDTAEAYRTEDMVGMAIKGMPRDQVVLSTKGSIRVNGRLKSAAEMEQSLDASLARLGTDHVDVYHLHGVSSEDYVYCRQELAPAMAKWKQAGKIRLTGITEAFASDTGHRMLQRAVRDDCWDVMMVGFNFLNQSARDRVLQTAMDKGIGILDMFAVRRALISPEQLAGYLERLYASGQADPARFDRTRPLAELIERGGYESLTEVAYRFCLAEPGISCVLVGTGNPNHLAQNLADIAKGPLPERDRAVLADLFALVDSESGN